MMPSKRQTITSLRCGMAIALASLPAQAQTFMTANPYFALRLGTPATAVTASHEVSFKISSGELEASRVQITYPSAFVFNGFLALGSANAPVGFLGVGADLPGIQPRGATPVYSLDNTSAYADADANGVYTPGTDPLIEYARFRSNQTLTIFLPLGGDANASTTAVPANLRISAFLLEGLFKNPALAGTYTVAANLTSVDPDNDGVDDGAGTAPQTFDTQMSFAIGGSSLCSTGPSLRCLEADKASFKIQKGATDAKDSVAWSWGKGDLFMQGATGDLTNTVDYALCVYDGSGGFATLRMALAVAHGASWQSKDPKGWKYKDKLGTSNGATKAALKPGVAGKSSMVIAGKGANLPMPIAAGGGKFFDSSPNVIVQLVNSKGVCWSSEFTTPSKNEATKYAAKSKAP